MMLSRRIRFSLSIFLLAAFGWAGDVQAQSPTPVTSIVNSNQDTTLQVGYNGSLLMEGTFINDGTERDSIPAEGAGTRLMWYPAKGAFRAGGVGGDFAGDKEWNADSTGSYSAAFGNSAQASGVSSLASGFSTTAAGSESVAFGDHTIARSSESLSIGECNSANRSSDGTLFVVGNGTQTFGSCDSRSDALLLDTDGNLTAAGKIEADSVGVELPDGTVLSGNEDLGVPTNSNGAFDLSNGDGVVASGTFGFGSIPTSGAGTRMMWYPAKAAFRAGRVGGIKDGTQWDDSSVGEQSVAFGLDTEASGNNATAMGQGTTANGYAATAMGQGTTANGYAATAMGQGTIARGDAATAIGEGSRASEPGATAIGDEAKAFGGAATAIGDHVRAATDSSLSTGYCNSANFSSDNSLFVVGNGTISTGSCDSRSDALVLEQNGDLTISGGLNENSDRRLKTGIEPIGEDVLRKLSRLRPVRYKFKNQSTHPSGVQIGLVAQDVQKEFPALVTEGSGGMLSLAYPKMTAVLLKGIQEQQAELETKKQEIANLKAENEEIKKRLAALERQHSSALPAGLAGPLGLAVLFGLGGLIVGILWRRRG
jgi:hypothetical protein